MASKIKTSPDDEVFCVLWLEKGDEGEGVGEG